jgi:hypothetical protein
MVVPGKEETKTTMKTALKIISAFVVLMVFGRLIEIPAFTYSLLALIAYLGFREINRR